MASLKKDYAAYLFDWDGTLGRTIEIWIDALMVMVAQFGGTPVRKFLSHSLGDLNSPIQSGVPKERADEFQRALAAYAVPRLSEVALYDGAKEYIMQLKAQGKKLALITTSRRETFELVLHRHNLVKHFDLILAQADVKAHKPDPEGILYALEQLGVSKSETLMVGDSTKDLGAARNASIDCLLFYPKTHRDVYSAEAFKEFNPIHTIETWKELLT